MPIPLAHAVDVLAGAAEARGAEQRLQERAEDLQALVGADLEAIEASLQQVCQGCPGPADAAARHLISRGGKRVRPLALLLSTACFGPVSAVAREMALVAEFIHSATLLHDDVIDDGMVRRGASTARRLWGNGVSVLAGDLLLVHALSRTLRSCPEALPGLLSTLRALVEGEVLQMRCRTEPDFSRDVYEQVLQGKTASLFAWATATGAQVGGASAEQQVGFASLGTQLGMAFQLIDDVLDYTGEQTGKTVLADLCEGKVTLPLVLALEARAGLEQDVRRVHAGDREPIGRLARAVVELGACDQVRQRALEHTQTAVQVLHALPSTPARALLERVAWELSRRTS